MFLVKFYKAPFKTNQAGLLLLALSWCLFSTPILLGQAKDSQIIFGKRYDGLKVGDELLVEAGSISAVFNAEMNYFPMSQILALSKDKDVVRVVLGKRQIYLFGKIQEMPVEAVSVDGKIYLPIKFLHPLLTAKWGITKPAEIKKVPDPQKLPANPPLTADTPATSRIHPLVEKKPEVTPTKPGGKRVTGIDYSIEKDYTQIAIRLSEKIEPVIKQNGKIVEVFLAGVDSTYLLPTKPIGTPEIEQVTLISPTPGQIQVNIFGKGQFKIAHSLVENPTRILVNVINQNPIDIQVLDRPTIHSSPLTEMGDNDLPVPLPSHWQVKSILVDAGHGGEDKGHVQNGLVESEINLDFSRRVGVVLKDFGYQVFHSKGENVSLKEAMEANPSLERRAILANRLDVDLVLSIHCDSSEDKSLRGPQVFYHAYYSPFGPASRTHFLENYLLARKERVPGEKVKLFGEKIQSSLSQILNCPKMSQSVLPVPFRFLGLVSMPAFQIELGFLSNREDSHFLKNNILRQKLARGLAEKIHEFLTAQERGL